MFFLSCSLLFFSINLYLNQNKLFYTLDSCKIDHHQSFSVFITIIIVTILNLVMILIIIILITTLDNKFDDDKNKSNNQYYWFSMAIVCLCMFECVCIADLIFSSYSIAYDFWLSFFFSNNHFRLLIIDIFVDLYLLIHAKLDNDFFFAPSDIIFPWSIINHHHHYDIIIVGLLDWFVVFVVCWNSESVLSSLSRSQLFPTYTHTHTHARTPLIKNCYRICCSFIVVNHPSFSFHLTIFYSTLRSLIIHSFNFTFIFHSRNGNNSNNQHFWFEQNNHKMTTIGSNKHYSLFVDYCSHFQTLSIIESMLIICGLVCRMPGNAQCCSTNQNVRIKLFVPK